MNNKNFLRETFTTQTNAELSFCSWIPTTIEKVLVLVHGMAEHTERYNRFAEQLTNNSIAAYAFDLRGHGKSAKTKEDLGFFGHSISFKNLIDDIGELIAYVKNKHSNIPIILFGHSMGSFIAQGVIQQEQNKLDACILSGTGMPSLLLTKTGKNIAWVVKKLKGENHKSQFLDNMAFSAYNKKIKNLKTKFDWLSRDEKEVEKYINDPLCGFLCSASFFYELTALNCYIQNNKNINKINKNLPLLFFAGTDDPVGNYTNDIKKLIQKYKSAGINNITEKYYEGGRHEMLNETNHQEVQDDIINWIINKIN